MATSSQLLRAKRKGAKIYCGEVEVQYRPDFKGDRRPWVHFDGKNWHWYKASECRAVEARDGD